MATNNFVV